MLKEKRTKSSYSKLMSVSDQCGLINFKNKNRSNKKWKDQAEIIKSD
jgi:hypothetical protein